MKVVVRRPLTQSCCSAVGEEPLNSRAIDIRPEREPATIKNALNQKNVTVKVPMRWIIDQDEEGNKTQTTFFDWDEALAKFLDPSDAKARQYSREAVTKFLCVNRHSEQSYSCKELKLKEEHPRIIGQAIESDPEMMHKLQPHMNIENINEFNYEEPI